MARVFMLVNYTPKDASIGITKKIAAQITAMRVMGHQVYYTAYVDGGTAVFDNDDNMVCRRDFPIKHRKIVGLIRYSQLLTTAKAFLRRYDGGFDICYGRLSAPNYAYLDLLRKLKDRGAKIILEALSYFPGVRPKPLKSKYIAFCLHKNQKTLRKLVDKFITEGEVKDFFGIPTEKGKIGVDTKNLHPHTYCGDPEELHLISVATEREYHGYDRLIASLAAYKAAGGQRKIFLHLVGGLYSSTKDLIKEYDLENCVFLYGRVCGAALDEIYAKCNMGVGPLGQHRVGGKKDTGLKTKEYFGIGLPYFYAGVEEDVPPEYPYILEVPSDESTVDMDAVWDFYERIRSDKNKTENMRAFAQEVFSWDSIMRRALQV